jgi:hypothetical protein
VISGKSALSRGRMRIDADEEGGRQWGFIKLR